MLSESFLLEFPSPSPSFFSLCLRPTHVSSVLSWPIIFEIESVCRSCFSLDRSFSLHLKDYSLFMPGKIRKSRKRPSVNTHHHRKNSLDSDKSTCLRLKCWTRTGTATSPSTRSRPCSKPWDYCHANRKSVECSTTHHCRIAMASTSMSLLLPWRERKDVEMWNESFRQPSLWLTRTKMGVSPSKKSSESSMFLEMLRRTKTDFSTLKSSRLS